jgi:hypothetical protein
LGDVDVVEALEVAVEVDPAFFVVLEDVVVLGFAGVGGAVDGLDEEVGLAAVDLVVVFLAPGVVVEPWLASAQKFLALLRRAFSVDMM